MKNVFNCTNLETKYFTGCDINRFKCANGLYCVIWWGICDGEDDCGDGSDERGCSNISWNSCK